MSAFGNFPDRDLAFALRGDDALKHLFTSQGETEFSDSFFTPAQPLPYTGYYEPVAQYGTDVFITGAADPSFDPAWLDQQGNGAGIGLYDDSLVGLYNSQIPPMEMGPSEPFPTSASPELPFNIAAFEALSLHDSYPAPYFDANGSIDPQILSGNLAAPMEMSGVPVANDYQASVGISSFDLLPPLSPFTPSTSPASSAALSVLRVQSPPYTPSSSPVSDASSAVFNIPPAPLGSPIITPVLAASSPPAPSISPAPDADSPVTSSASISPSSSSASAGTPRRRASNADNHSRNVQSTMDSDAAVALARKRGQCQVCGRRPNGSRKAEFIRHVRSHFRRDSYSLCAGVPVSKPRSRLSYYFEGQWYDGGCRMSFSRKDSLKRHCERKNTICVFMEDAPYNPKETTGRS